MNNSIKLLVSSGRGVVALAMLLCLIFGGCKNPSSPSLSSTGFNRNVVDTNPSVTPLSPAESMAKVVLPPGYHLQLVASEPMVQEPVAIAWDGNGAMYVAEMNTYMKDASGTGKFEPVSHIKRLTDTDGDGTMDAATIFIDSLVLPRVILPVGDELIVGVTNVQHLHAYKDVNGDGKADTKRLVFKNDQLDVRNLEHQNGGLLWNMDNWIYPTRDNLRYRYVDGVLKADTMVDNMIGQWGITSDDYGKLFYSEAGPGLPAVQIQQLPAYGALNFKDQYAETFTTAWPIIGNIDAQGGREALRPEDNTLRKFTSGCGQSIYRGDKLPGDMLGDYFIAEPVGRIIKRGEVTSTNGKVFIDDVYKEKDWLASADMNFRPINTYTGPDGYLYIVDMYHGIIQESEWTEPGSYLGKIIEEKKLYKNRGMGRIYRVVHDSASSASVRPNMLNEPSSKLVQYLHHATGWWRDNAQQLIIIRKDTSVAAELRLMAAGKKGSQQRSPSTLARIHALWTLEGLQKIDQPTLYAALADPDAQVRKAAIWIGEQFIRQNDHAFIEKLSPLIDDASIDVRIQLYLSLRRNNTGRAKTMVSQLLQKNSSNEMMQFSNTAFVAADKMRREELQRTQNLSEKDRQLVTKGEVIFKQLCATCHGVDGRGVAMGGNALPAPPLAGSPRVKGDKILLTQLLLWGLKGPVDGKTYNDMMPSMAGNDNHWIASVLSYIRNSAALGNKASVVTEAEVKSTRENSPKEIPGGATIQLLEIFKLGRAERTNWGGKEKK